jgi:nitrate reductase NapD
MNICGCLVHARPEQAADLAAQLAEIDGVEVHAVSADGRLVVVVEDTEEDRASEIIMSIQKIPAVVSLTLTYHNFEATQDDRTGNAGPSSPETPETGAQS